MKLKVNQLTVTLHLRVGDDITLQDSKQSNIASMVLDSLERGSRIINIGNGNYIFARDVMSAEIVMSQREQRYPDPCPSDDPCATLDPPTIIGVPTEVLVVGVGEEFDPLEGVTAFDGYGEPLEVSVSVVS
ncbi:MAG: hypothetical protein U0L88_11665 [Acutalibacteraceae bacterium]|nr:hypothetical protein [Acutalibacteraceae bacterium]